MINWQSDAWGDYVYWQREDKRILKRINALITDIQRHPFDGIGKPEPLKYDWTGFWSRRINDKHRLIYCYENENIIIAQCRYHYSD